MDGQEELAAAEEDNDISDLELERMILRILADVPDSLPTGTRLLAEIPG